MVAGPCLPITDPLPHRGHQQKPTDNRGTTRPAGCIDCLSGPTTHLIPSTLDWAGEAIRGKTTGGPRRAPWEPQRVSLLLAAGWPEVTHREEHPLQPDSLQEFQRCVLKTNRCVLSRPAPALWMWGLSLWGSLTASPWASLGQIGARTVLNL